MLFNSLAFGIFLPVVFAIYWLIPHKYRWLLLLIASYYFYMSWNAGYVFLLLFTTGATYAAGLILARVQSTRAKKAVLAAALIVCLGLLFTFKYFNFFFASLTELFALFSIPLHPVTLKLLLPVGISFYTFQTLGYVMDVYRGKQAPERHFGKYAVFSSFFPLLIAGPIERAGRLLPQLDQETRFDYDKAVYGLKLMAWGFFKKLVIADNLARYADLIFDSPKSFAGFSLLLASLFYTVQIYCDFSGYSDIAIGTSKLLGIDLAENFKSPYFSSSVKEFWSRWHISLSTWFRDYVYIPLGGNRVKPLRHKLNLLITFLLSGLWHGASWNFVAWGGFHGLVQIFESLVPGLKKSPRSKLLLAVRTATVFLFCSFAWIFFRAASFGDAVHIITHMFDGVGDLPAYFALGFADVNMRKLTLAVLAVGIALLTIFDLRSLSHDVIAELSGRPAIFRYAVYLGLLTMLICFRAHGEAIFVYFQF